jgi:hypothetical protein
MTKNKRQIILAFCLGIILFIAVKVNVIAQLPGAGTDVRPEMAAEIVYQRLPYLPLENKYISQELDRVSPNNTLISRFINYHESIKSRPLQYRLDWQLTFADYFGINEPITAERYPGYQTLTVNPIERDRDIITKLTRNQRNQLIDTLLSIYNPPTETKPQVPATTPNNSPEERNDTPTLPQPGDADLLLPAK